MTLVNLVNKSAALFPSKLERSNKTSHRREDRDREDDKVPGKWNSAPLKKLASPELDYRTTEEAHKRVSQLRVGKASSGEHVPH